MKAITKLKDAAHAFLGTPHARSERVAYLKGFDSIAPHIAAIDSRAMSPVSDENPIFILSAGWRSGSTLVQRLLMSNGHTLIWGEPYDRLGIIQSLTRSLFAFSSEWPDAKYFDASKEWVANLYPPIACLKSGYLALIENLFVQPSREQGAKRWGLKEVRLGVRDAQFLQWLYPKAKFLFIYRNPFDAYTSYKSFSDRRNWYAMWPHEHVFTPSAFGKHWRRLAVDFHQNAELVNGLVIKYEDLKSGKVDPSELANYCEIDIDKSVLEIWVGRSNRRSHPGGGISRLERLLLSRSTNPVAEQLGYR